MTRGFTLIEVLTVMVVTGILLALGTPRLVGALDRWAVERAVAEVGSFYHSARFAAVVARHRVRIEFSPDSLVAVVEADRDSTFLVAPGPAHHGVGLTASRRTVRVWPTGVGLGAGNTKLVFWRGAASDSLAISRLGRLRRMR